MGLFLLKYWKYIALAVLVAGVAFYHYTLTSTISDQKLKLLEQKVQIDSLNDSLKTQNDAVAQLKIDADTREAEGKKAIEAAKAQVLTYKQRADALRRAQPKFPEDLCKSANDLINEELKK